MKTTTNVKKITKGARIGKIATFAGLGFLVAGLVISLMLQESPLLWLSFGFLLLGLLVSSVGTMNMNRWVREPRADQALEQGLKGLDDRYWLYNHTLPAPHVLLGPIGVYVLTALGQDGVIRYEGGKFRRDFSIGRVLRFMADEGLGRPFEEANAQVQSLRKFLDEHDAAKDVEIQNVLVFYNPRVELSMTEPPQPPAVAPKGLKKALRRQQEPKLTAVQYEQLKALFEENAG